MVGRRLTAALAPTMVVFAAGLAACGGSGGEETITVSAPPPGRAAYVAEADALCARVATRADGLVESAEELRSMGTSDPAFVPAAAEHFGRVLELATSFREEFVSVEPPEADRERIAELMEVNDAAIEALDSMVDRLQAGEVPTEESEEYVRLLDQASVLAERYGFEVCARVS